MKTRLTKIKSLAYLLISAVTVMCLLVLVGWQFNVDSLKRPMIGVVSMNPLTAINFVVTATASLLLFSRKLFFGQYRVAYTLVLFVAVVCLLRLLALVHWVDFSVDQFLFTKETEVNVSRGRVSSMAWTTALNFLLLSIALSLLKKRVTLFQVFVFLTALLSFFPILGYLYRIPEFYTYIRISPMSLLTAICFLLLCLSFLFLSAEKGWLKEFSGSEEALIFTRILLPSVIIFPITIGYIRMWGHWKALISTAFGVSLIIFSVVTIFILLIFYSVRVLNRVGGTRRTLEAQLQESQEQLQTTNEELVASNEELRSANEELLALNDQLVESNGKIHEQSTVIIRQKEEALRRYEQSMEIIFSNTVEGIYVMDVSGKVIFFNHAIVKATEAVSGLKPELGMYVWDMTSEARGEISKELFHRALSGEMIEVEVPAQVGEKLVIYSLRYSPVRVEDQVRFVTIVSVDVTAKKEKEEELRKSEANLKAIFDSTPDAYTLLDTELNIVAFNESNAKYVEFLTGRKLVTGKSIFDVMPVSRQGDFRERVERANREGAVVTTSQFGEGDQRRWFESSLIAVRDQTSRIIGYCISGHELTQTKKTEEVIVQLNRSLTDFQNAIYRSSIVSIADSKGNIIFVNDNFVKISGYIREELMGQNHRLINSGFHPRSFWANMWKTILAGKIWRERVKNKTKDGGYYWVDTFIMPFVNEEGRITQILSIRNDISAHKNTEEELLQSLSEIEKLSLVASTTNNGVIITDKEGRLEWVNESFTRLTGYTVDEVRSRSMKFLQGPETDVHTLQRISENLKKNELVSEELVNYNKDGTRFWIKLDIAPVFDQVGQVKNFIAVQTDITELKEYENSITLIAQELGSLIENANVPIFGVDADGNLNEWNNAAVDLSGFFKTEIIGNHWSNIFASPIAMEQFDKVVKLSMQGKSISNIEVPVFSRFGTRLTLLVSTSPRRDMAGVITGVLFVGQNITELIDYRTNLEQKVDERTRALQNALDKEKELVRMKTQFVSIASHEFRTPLTTITLASGFLRRYMSKISPEVMDEKLQNIEKQVTHMTFLLDDVLMIGKADSGKIQIIRQSIQISAFIQNLIKEVTKVTGNTHKVNYSEFLCTEKFLSDEKLLRNVMINLLTNAIKFSPGAGRVDVSVAMDELKFYFKVKDYGIGIPEEDIKNLFEPFFRGRNTESIQGTGLGLSIIKKAVDLLNGKIAIKSNLNEGTEIQIELPVK